MRASFRGGVALLVRGLVARARAQSACNPQGRFRSFRSRGEIAFRRAADRPMTQGRCPHGGVSSGDCVVRSGGGSKRNSAMRLSVAISSPLCEIATCLLAAASPLSAKSGPGRSLEDLFEEAEPAWFRGAGGRRGCGRRAAGDRPGLLHVCDEHRGAGPVAAGGGAFYLDNRRDVDSHSYPEFIARYGLTERLERGWAGTMKSAEGGRHRVPTRPGTRRRRARFRSPRSATVSSTRADGPGAVGSGEPP